MTDSPSAREAYERIDKAIAQMGERVPQLSTIYDAFRELMARQAAVKAYLADRRDVQIEMDPAKYSQGLPLLDSAAFSVGWDLLRKAAGEILPAMEKGFPRVRDQIAALRIKIEGTESEDDILAHELGSTNKEQIDDAAGRLAIDASVIEFAIGQVRKPFAEKVADTLPALPENLQWTKGYCPVCGSWPELSYLEGKEGRRCLRCSFCGHEWQFMRTQCPFCETTELEKIELIYQDERPFERAELCHACKKYIVSMDFRDIAFDLPHEVAALGLVYLDMLAQERGFSPGAICAWNMVGLT